MAQIGQPSAFDMPELQDELDRPFRLNNSGLENDLLDRSQLGRLMRPLRLPVTNHLRQPPQPPTVRQVAWQQEADPAPVIDGGMTIRRQTGLPNLSSQLNAKPLRDPAESPAEFVPESPAPLSVPQPTPPLTQQPPVDAEPVFIGPMPSPEMEASWKISDSVLNMPIELLREELNKRKLAVESAANLDEETRNIGLGVVGGALESIAIAQQNVTETSKLRRRIQTLDQQIADLEFQLKDASTVREADSSLTLEQMQIVLRDLETELDNENHESRKIEDSIQHRDERKAKIPSERVAFRKQLDDLHEKMVQRQSNGTEEYTSLLTLRAKELHASTASKLLEVESEWLELSQRLFPMQQDLHARIIVRLNREIEAWGVTLADRRRRELGEQIRVARQNASEAHPALRELVTQTADLAKVRAELAEMIKHSSTEKFEVQSLVHELESRHKELENAVVRVGSEGSSYLLIEAHHALVPPFESMARIRSIKQKLLNVKVDELKLRVARRPLADEERYISEVLMIKQDQVVANTTLKEMARESVVAHRRQVDELLHEYDDFINLLGESETARKNLLTQINTTRKYIDDRALWVQTADQVDLSVLLKSQQGAEAFFKLDHWRSVGASIGSHVVRRPYESVVGLFGMLGVFAVSRKLSQTAYRGQHNE